MRAYTNEYIYQNQNTFSRVVHILKTYNINTFRDKRPFKGKLCNARLCNMPHSKGTYPCTHTYTHWHTYSKHRTTKPKVPPGNTNMPRHITRCKQFGFALTQEWREKNLAPLCPQKPPRTNKAHNPFWCDAHVICWAGCYKRVLECVFFYIENAVTQF